MFGIAVTATIATEAKIKSALGVFTYRQVFHLKTSVRRVFCHGNLTRMKYTYFEMNINLKFIQAARFRLPASI